MTSPPQIPPLPNTITLEIKILTYELEGEGATLQPTKQGYCENQKEILHLKAIGKVYSMKGASFPPFISIEILIKLKNSLLSWL